MKQALLIILLILFITSCSNYDQCQYWYVFNQEKWNQIEEKYINLLYDPIFQDEDIIEKCNKILSEEIHYKDESILEEFWQYPEETLEFKTGDCEDFALLFAALIYKLENKKVNFIEWNIGNEICSHMNVSYDGKIYEIHNGEIFTTSEFMKKYNATINTVIPFDKMSEWLYVYRGGK